MTFEVLYQGNPLAVVRSFGTKNYKICINQKLLILYASFESPDRLINIHLEIHGSCLYKP